MNIRPLDEHGDIVPVSDLSQMASGKKAVGEIVNLRLQLYHGEWWENRDAGFRVPELLMNNVRNGEVSLLANYIATYVSESEGVRGVSDVVVIKNGHELSVKLVAKTNEGKTITTEVNLNGVL